MNIIPIRVERDTLSLKNTAIIIATMTGYMNSSAAEIPESMILNARNQKRQVNAINTPAKIAGTTHFFGSVNGALRNAVTIPINIAAIEKR